MTSEVQVEEQAKPTAFELELQQLLNRTSQENGSNTPDFILAAYMQGCLSLFNTTVQNREAWYGRPITPGLLTHSVVSTPA